MGRDLSRNRVVRGDFPIEAYLVTPIPCIKTSGSFVVDLCARYQYGNATPSGAQLDMNARRGLGGKVVFHRESRGV